MLLSDDSSMSRSNTRQKRHRFPAEVIQYGVWLYHRTNLSHRDIEDLLVERGIVESNESLSRRRRLSPLYRFERRSHRKHKRVSAHRKVPGIKCAGQFRPVVTVRDAASFLIRHRDDRWLRLASDLVEYHRLLSHPGQFCEPGPGVLARRR